MPPLDPPVDPRLDDALRLAVLALRTTAGERGGAPALHLGDPAEPEGEGHVVVRVEDPTGSCPCSGRSSRRRPAPLDDALRTDVVHALLGDLRRHVLRGHRDRPGVEEAVDAGIRAAPPLAWLTRAGRGRDDQHDADREWGRAVGRAGAEHGFDATFVVVTPHGWWDPRGTADRSWVRLRARGAADAALVRGWVVAQSQACTGSLECMRSR